MISILIPVYNYPVTELVSTLHQQAENAGIPFEIIIVDDCSTFSEIATKNQSLGNKSCCSYFSNSTNQGRTFTRNLLAEKAKYDWLLFLDADVLPESQNFMSNFQFSNSQADLIFGGISYSPIPPEKSKMLRWKYGKKREAKLAEKRKKTPYLSLISGCCLIRKNSFIKANDHLKNVYGADVLFAKNLETMNAKVQHIDNPVVHYGLENNLSFIAKTEKAMQTISDFSNSGKIPNNYRPIQKAYLRLKKHKLLNLFLFCMENMNSLVQRNLTSKNPSLFLFDLYRLYYYATLNQ